MSPADPLGRAFLVVADIEWSHDLPAIHSIEVFMSIDFTKLFADLEAEMSPEERLRAREYDQLEARYEATRRTIEAQFARVSVQLSKRNVAETTIMDSWTKMIDCRIEATAGGEVGGRESIRFIGSPVASRYELSDEFVSDLVAAIQNDPDVEFSLCFGSDKYVRCEVKAEDVAAYLRDVRPGLLPDKGPTLK